MSSQLVRTGLYLIRGGGGNSLLRFSAGGLILVDAKAAGTYRALKAQVKKIAGITDLPMRVLVLTDHHASHTGNATEFLAAGVPIIAQQNAKPYLAADIHSGAKSLPPWSRSTAITI